jgi:hypothetical protein
MAYVRQSISALAHAYCTQLLHWSAELRHGLNVFSIRSVVLEMKHVNGSSLLPFIYVLVAE